MTYSEILSSTAIEYKISEEDLAEVKLKPKDKYKIIGRSMPAMDIPEKINGKARFGIDAYVPNMVYGKIVPAPTRVGSTIKKIDDTAARQIDGYIKTLPLNFPPAVQGNVIPTALVIAVQKLPNSRHRPSTTLDEASPNALFEEKSKRPTIQARKPVAKDLVARNSGKHRRRPPNGASSQRLESRRWALVEFPVAYRKCAGRTVGGRRFAGLWRLVSISEFWETRKTATDS